MPQVSTRSKNKLTKVCTQQAREESHSSARSSDKNAFLCSCLIAVLWGQPDWTGDNFDRVFNDNTRRLISKPQPAVGALGAGRLATLVMVHVLFESKNSRFNLISKLHFQAYFRSSLFFLPKLPSFFFTSFEFSGPLANPTS